MDLLYELWMQDVCGFDPKIVDKCMFVFKNAYNAFHSKPYSVDRIKAFGMYGFVSAPKNLERAESIMDDCREKGIRILSIEDEEYPELLRQIYLPPRLLFVTGTLKNFNGCFPVSVVGTRRATEQGKYFTQRLTEKLCRKNNILIVSGMAEGIDAAAHRGALKAGAKTVAVLAGGCDIIYPLSNRKLYYEILENGAVHKHRRGITCRSARNIKPDTAQRYNSLTENYARLFRYNKAVFLLPFVKIINIFFCLF